MSTQQLLNKLLESEAKIGIVKTLSRFYGRNIKIKLTCSGHICSSFLYEYNFSTRSLNALNRLELFTIGDVIHAVSRNQLHLSSKNGIGPKSMSEIKTKLLFICFESLSYSDKQLFFETLIADNELPASDSSVKETFACKT